MASRLDCNILVKRKFSLQNEKTVDMWRTGHKEFISIADAFIFQRIMVVVCRMLKRVSRENMQSCKKKIYQHTGDNFHHLKWLKPSCLNKIAIQRKYVFVVFLRLISGICLWTERILQKQYFFPLTTDNASVTTSYWDEYEFQNFGKFLFVLFEIHWCAELSFVWKLPDFCMKVTRK